MAYKCILPLMALLGLAIPARAAITPGAEYYVELFNPNSSPIGPTNASGLCLAAASNTDGAAVSAQPCRPNTLTQSWVFSPAATGGTTTIKVFGDKCLDVTNGVDASGTKLQIYGCSTGNKNQQWQVTTDSSGIEHVQWVNSTRCVDLTGGSAGAAFQIWTCEVDNANQQFLTFDATLVPPASYHGTHILSDLQQDSAPQLSIQATDPSNNTPVAMANSDDDNHGIEWGYDGTTLSVFEHQFCLDVIDGVDADGTKLQIYECTAGNTNQEWVITGGSHGDFSTSTIQWKNHNKCVDLTDGKLIDGNQLQIWTCSALNTNQEWNIFAVN